MYGTNCAGPNEAKKVVEQFERSERDKLSYNLSNQPSPNVRTATLGKARKEARAKERLMLLLLVTNPFRNPTQS